jgi:hypothetical protein
MPRRVKNYPWDKAKLLYMQGVTMSQIAEQTGIPLITVRGTIQRKRWTVERSQLHGDPGDGSILVKETVDAVSRRFKQWFLDDAQRVMTALETHDPNGLELKELEQRESVVKSLHSRLSGQLGWGQEVEQHAIRGNLLSQLAAEITQQREIVLDRQAKSKVIDVQPVTNEQQIAGQDAAVSNACCASTSDCQPDGEKHAFLGPEPAGG